MPIHHAVLSLLEDGPSHGYELKASFEEAVGPQWGPLNIGHLYQILGRLVRDGLVRSRREPQATRPERVVYEITATGRAELSHWLARPATRSGGFRDDLFLKMMAAARSHDGSALARVLSAQRSYLLGELRDLAELRRSRGEDTVVRLLITAAELQARAQLQFLDVAEEELLLQRGATPGSRVRGRTAAGGTGDATAGARRGGASDDTDIGGDTATGTAGAGARQRTIRGHSTTI
jgi:DNA-binding PadR family transcriptional regulator